MKDEKTDIPAHIQAFKEKALRDAYKHDVQFAPNGWEFLQVITSNDDNSFIFFTPVAAEDRPLKLTEMPRLPGSSKHNRCFYYIENPENPGQLLASATILETHYSGNPFDKDKVISMEEQSVLWEVSVHKDFKSQGMAYSLIHRIMRDFKEQDRPLTVDLQGNDTMHDLYVKIMGHYPGLRLSLGTHEEVTVDSDMLIVPA